VQISHARLSSLVCDGNKGRGKIVVGVAAHYPRQLRASRVRQKSGVGLLASSLLQAYVNHFI
jgi:hypothetical protein